VGSKGPTAETCDGKDNDCNGLVDDPFTAAAPGGYIDGAAGQQPRYNSSTATCGSCAQSCGLQHATNSCVTDATIDATGHGVCKVLTCNAGFNYVPSAACGNAPAENGKPCPAGQTCQANGTCTVSGNVCGVGCNYTCPVFPATPEVCDGKDNDC